MKPTRSANRIETRRRSAVGASGLPAAAAAPGLRRSVPHSPQNLTPGAFDVPHDGHADARAVPHSPQNFLPGSFVVPQTGQSNGLSCVRVASIRAAWHEGQRDRCAATSSGARRGSAIHSPVLRHRRQSRRKRLLGPLGIGIVAFVAIGGDPRRQRRSTAVDGRRGRGRDGPSARPTSDARPAGADGGPAAAAPRSCPSPRRSPATPDPEDPQAPMSTTHHSPRT